MKFPLRVHMLLAVALVSLHARSSTLAHEPTTAPASTAASTAAPASAAAPESTAPPEAPAAPAATAAPASSAGISPELARRLYEQTTPSLVAVQFTWEYEFGKADFVSAGVVVSSDGLIMLPGGDLIPRLPVSQLRDFKIIIPREDKDNEELDAELIGADRRSEVAFVRAKAKREWKPVQFVDAPLKVGDPIVSIGVMARDAGYRSYLSEGTVAAHQRGEVPTIIVTGGLANVGAPVFNAAGQAAGWVNSYAGTQYLLHTTLTRGRGREQQISAVDALINPPVMFVPSSFFLPSVKDPPVAGERLKLAWLGMPNLTGMDKDVSAAYGLEDQPAVEIGDVVPGSPAEQAGLRVGMKIVKVNGKPLERGDLPEELPMILTRKITRMPVGSKVTFSALTEKDKPASDYTVTLGERPIQQNYANRFWAEDLGFGVRNLVFDDTYERKQPADTKGVIVTIIKANSAAASGKLVREDVITQFNNQPVTDVDQFEKDYQALRKEKPKEAIVLVVMKRDASTQTIRIEPPQ